MSTNLSGNTLTLGNTSLNEETLKAIKGYYYVPDNCKAGDTVILDGIECICVATGVTIQGSTLTRIAVDKNHDLGYYQKYLGSTQGGAQISVIKAWKWGGYGTTSGNTSQEVGYGLQNTIKCLNKPENYTKGDYTGPAGETCPWLWRGVNDFRSSHSDKWFVPSINELLNYVYPYRSSLNFDTITGGSSTGHYLSSSEESELDIYILYINNGGKTTSFKYIPDSIRMCRAF